MERWAEKETRINMEVWCAWTHKTLFSSTNQGSAQPPQLCQISRIYHTWAVTLEEPNPQGSNKWVPLPFIDASCLAMGMLVVREKRGTVITWWIACLCISSWVSLLISVLLNPPGTQGFPRETGFPSQWKEKWPLRDGHNITQLLIPHLSK